MTAFATHRLQVLYLTADLPQAWRFKQEFRQELDVQVITDPVQALAACAEPTGFVALIVAADPGSACGLLARPTRHSGGRRLPVLWWLPPRTAPTLLRALREVSGGNVLVQGIDNARLLTRLYALARPSQLPAVPALRVPVRKRLLDIACAGTAIVLLSPLLALLALLIKLESRGPLFYYSYRVGAGYRAFRLWKLRSMHPGSGEQLAALRHLNYHQAGSSAAALATAGRCAGCSRLGGCGQQAAQRARLHCGFSPEVSAPPAFIKILNDPHLTHIGRFLRATRLEELPQLYNVLRGDMSLVGNRPLPLCAAKQLFTNEYSARFLAPAGITGPWQLGYQSQPASPLKPGCPGLDTDYIWSFSLRKDLKIILKTLPALFQKESV